MILPIRTSVAPHRTPYANYFFIAANAVVFLLTYNWQSGSTKPIANAFMLWPDHPTLYQFITYAFLHANIWHIVGNMFFLYLFGNNVNDKFGNVGYICFYLAGGVFSAIGHCFIHAGSPIPILGASGAVAAVTGAFLVLFPQTLITVMYMFIFIGSAEIPALYFIAFKMIIIDNLISRGSNVAYDAHLAGYAYGIVVSVLLLATHLISGSGLDLWTMIKQWNRRRVYRDSVTSGYDPYAGRLAKRVEAREVPNKPTPGQLKITEMRDQITDYLAHGNLSEASRIYLDLIAFDEAQLLPRQQLLDIANHLMSTGQWQAAARAYELFLSHYGNYDFSEQVELMLGILYARYLKDAAKAQDHLNKALTRLHDPGQIAMCKRELDAVANQ